MSVDAPIAAPDDTSELTLEPTDNQRLANLCGVLDENIRQIENALDVTLARRGATFRIEGEATRRALAIHALEQFYVRAIEVLTVEDIQLGLIEMGRGAEQMPEEPTLHTKRRDLRGRTRMQSEYLRAVVDHDITFGIGPAGTGKTYLAVACAVDALERDAVKRIVLVRPAVEAGERLGFLPGDLTQKVDPYLRPLYDALYDLMGVRQGRQAVRAWHDRDRAARLHARSHAQPLVHHPRRSAEHDARADEDVPHAHRDSAPRPCITGDVTQIDLARGQKSGLVEAREVLGNIDGIAFTLFESVDVVRHPLVQRIVNAYETHPAERQDKPQS
jgi:phosphate starvation-inducible PhoH-like protein